MTIFLPQPFKVYISFENSLCEDYVTEKFWRPIRNHQLPLIMNGADMSKVAPPHSYLHVDDFESPKVE